MASLAPDDPRLGDHIVDVSVELEGKADRALEQAEEQIVSKVRDADVVLVGFPYDEGVRRNGGRVGAAGGPAAAFEFLRRTGTVDNPEFGVSIRPQRVLQSGMIPPGLELEEGHRLLENRVHGIMSRGGVPVVVGGGNDQSYASACGMMRAMGHLGTASAAVINIDAHLDVRPKKLGRVHSGSPFRMLLEDSRFAGRFVEYAAQGSQCSKVHADYILGRGHAIHWFMRDVKASGDVVRHFQSVLADLAATSTHIFLSFDIDAIQGADCPGVSAPAVVGLSAREALEIMYVAGQERNVRLVDFSEFNPTIERDRTGRLVANLIYYFLLGRSIPAQ